MSKEKKEILEFGPFRLDCGEALLTRLGTPVPLPPKVFDLLVYLVSKAGRLVEKEELLKALWPDSFVEEANLTVNIAALRRALGSQPDGQPWIETVPKRGYRFLVTVSRPAESVAPVLAIEPLPEAPPAIAPARATGKYLVAAAILLTAGSVYLYLHGLSRSNAVSQQQSIAVLPFQDLSTGGDDIHAGLGMTDALITKLGALPELTVRSITTVRKYDGSATDPLDAGRALGADTVLTGSVQRLDKRIRVTVRLLRVRDGQSLWADKFDEFLTNIFAVQDAISEKLAHVLALRLTSEDQDRMIRRYTENTEAFRLYELGRYERSANPLMALEHLQRSIREDSRYALPYVELASIYLGLSGNGTASFQRFAPLAREAAATALRLAPELADAPVAAGDVKKTVDRDYQGAQRELDTALHLNRGSAKVHSSRGNLLAIQGDLTSALQEARTAMSLDPFSGELAGDLAWILYCNHQYQAAIEWMDEFKQRDSRPQVEWNRFYCYLKMSRTPEAIALMEEALKSQGSKRPITAVLAHAYALAGRGREAKELLKSLPQDWGYYQRAVVDLALGDRDAALAHLDQAVDERSVFIPWLKVDPDLEPLRGDPRFAKVVARVALTP
jgi:DNA-binding winged helix-turn-helix (wHTH) protein/TolB-like protein/Tfp pilus assembly protein PilF